MYNMNILQINNTDLAGARFNGYNIMTRCHDENFHMKQLVLDKYSTEPNVISFADSICTSSIYINFERKHSIHSVIIPYGRKIMGMSEFQEADVVHYHLIHNGVLSLLDMPMMFDAKKSVWSIHDPWIFTGHCIHPIECRKFLNGCIGCEHLERYFPMQEDRAHEMWCLKQKVFKCLDVDIVVASKWMEKLVRESPLTSHWQKIHRIPFGVDLCLYGEAGKKRQQLRRKLQIPDDAVVLFFRADKSEYKGLSYIEAMLEKLHVSNKVVLLTVGEKGLLKRLSSCYKVIDNGWLNDEAKMVELYGMADIFLMPSVAEAFGVMAVEAMAAGLPVVVMEGTALPSVVNAPRAGCVFGRGNIEEFTAIVESLIVYAEKRHAMGKKCRRLAEAEYDEKLYFTRMLNLYRMIG